MTRHRAPHARSDESATIPFARPAAGSSARHRAPGRSALRHGAVAFGITGTALAVVAPGALQAPPVAGTAGVEASLTLSTPGSALGADAARTGGAPVATAARGGAVGSDLIKAADRTRAASASVTAAETASARPERAATEEPATPKPTATPAQTSALTSAAASGASPDCGASSSYGGVAASVKKVGNALECVFPGHEVLGVGGRGGTSDHPGGYALDMMTTDGDAIAACVLDHADALGVSYVIWNQRINTGGGWKGMEDRGGDTANHKDHVHISFERGGAPDVSVLADCG